MKGKVVEAMRFGLPIVTTPTGMQGLSGATTFVPAPDDAHRMIDAILMLLQDDESWRQQSHRQQQFVRDNFSVETLRRVLAADLPADGAQRPGSINGPS